MTLYCAGCGTLHRFTASEVERIVYALQVGEADERTRTGDRPHAGGDSYVAIVCLKNVLGWSAPASEMYDEAVENFVENRRALARDETKEAA